MPGHAIQLDDKRFRVAKKRAKALGTTPDDLVNRLIDAEDALGNISFDQLLAPVREGFKHLSDDQLDALFKGARKRAGGSKR